MGRYGKGKGKKKGKVANKGDGSDAGAQGQKKDAGQWKHQPWQPLVPHNDLFVEYYKGQNIVPPEEWDAFYKSLQTPLPTTFRVTASSYFAPELLRRIEAAGYHRDEPFEIDGELVEPPRRIDWYPGGLAWHTSIPRKVLKRSPDLETFHKFLISQSEQGNITRQEAVSMLPPLFLDVQPHHTVLDMCAAPGSKTTQIIELLHAKDNAETKLPPKGLVIANDVEKDRCYMLVHHTKRLGSPAIVVTNNPAQTYPRLPVRLDRILADVPCTGDGTLRKNVDLWRRWSPTMGPGLHNLQVRIAYRAAQMLNIGGRMVYSTCSLNPVEDEAVVMELIRQTGGAMELIDVSKVLPGLKFSPGISKWRMMDKDNSWYSEFKDVPAMSKNKLKQSMFPPTEEEAKTANLHYGLRILPHSQNTGGFFIAVLHKKAKLPPPKNTGRQATDAATTTSTTNTATTTTQTEQPQPTASASTEKPQEQAEDEDVIVPEGEDDKVAAEDAGEEPPTKKRRERERTWVEEPFLSLSPEMQEKMKLLQEFYGMAELPLDQIFTRSTKSHKLYYVTESIADLIRKIQDGPKTTNLTIINSGVKLFHRHEASEHGFRVCQDSVQWVLPMITKRRVVIEHADLVRLLTHGTLYPNNFSAVAEQTLNSMAHGCVVFVVDPNTKSPSSGMGFVGWFARKNINLLIKKKELTSLKNLFCKEEPAAATATTTSDSTNNNNTAAAATTEPAAATTEPAAVVAPTPMDV